MSELFRTFAPEIKLDSMNTNIKSYCFSLIICALSTLLYTACKGENPEQQARERVSQARTLIQENNLEAAKVQLDSVHILFRQQVDARREAKALQDTIALLEAERTAAYADSMLQTLLPQVDPLLKKFRYEKDERYEDHGQYVSRLLQTTSNTERCFIQAYVGDNRLTRVKSYYYGSATLIQNGVELCLQPNEDCNTWQGSEHHFSTSSDSEASSSSRNIGGFHSILTLEGDPAIELLAFIASQPDAKVRVRLHGNNAKGQSASPYTYVLSKNDKAALVETLQLATLFHDIHRLEEMLNSSKNTISKLQMRAIKG